MPPLTAKIVFPDEARNLLSRPSLPEESDPPATNHDLRKVETCRSRPAVIPQFLNEVSGIDVPMNKVMVSSLDLKNQCIVLTV
jgi:hypothetical protein